MQRSSESYFIKTDTAKIEKALNINHYANYCNLFVFYEITDLIPDSWFLFDQ